jgi:hypothetical protein
MLTAYSNSEVKIISLSDIYFFASSDCKIRISKKLIVRICLSRNFCLIRLNSLILIFASLGFTQQALCTGNFHRYILRHV